MIIFISGEGNGNPLQYSCLENPVDRGAWRAAVHRVAQSQTRLRLSMHACIGEGNGNPLQYSWRTPGTEVSGGLLSMGLHRVGHDWSDLAAAAELFPFLLLQHWFHHVFPYFARPLSLASCPYFFFFPCQTFFMMSVRVISTKNRSDKTTVQLKSGRSFLLP